MKTGYYLIGALVILAIGFLIYLKTQDMIPEIDEDLRNNGFALFLTLLFLVTSSLLFSCQTSIFTKSKITISLVVISSLLFLYFGYQVYKNLKTLQDAKDSLVKYSLNSDYSDSDYNDSDYNESDYSDAEDDNGVYFF